MNVYASVLFLTALLGPASAYVRVCYYTNWSQYRPEGATFFPEDIDVTLCSHLVYAFATLEGNQLKTTQPNDEDLYKRFNELKQINPELKTLLAVGGYAMGTAKMTTMLATEETRKEFVDTSITFLRGRDFDGLDLDFEFPGTNGSPPEDKQKFTSLLQELRSEFEAEAKETGGERLVLSASVSGGKYNVNRAYEADIISRELDFIFLMSYDFISPQSNHTGHQSALYPIHTQRGHASQLNVAWAANYWVSKGCPKEKLVIGLATYGRGFVLCDDTQTEIGACAKRGNTAGTYTREDGFLSYYEVCEKLGQGAVRKWNEDQKVPFAVFDGSSGKEWVGYEDPDSLTYKVEWLKTQGFAGFMVWTISLDDFTGSFCGQGKYPLLRSMNKALGNKTLSAESKLATSQPSNEASNQAQATTETSDEVTTAEAPSVTTKPPVQTTPNLDAPCGVNTPHGFYPHRDCGKFFRCFGHGRSAVFLCAAGTLFDGVDRVCNHAYLVPHDHLICDKD